MSSKHTPGQWRTGSRLTRVEVLPDGWNVAICIADCDAKNAPESEAEKVANAALIAAAPELLEALKKLHSYFITDNIPDASLPDDEDFVRMENASHAAIAKAEGR